MIIRHIIFFMFLVCLLSCHERNNIKTIKSSDSTSFKVDFVEINLDKTIKDSTTYLEKEFNFKEETRQLIGYSKNVIPDSKTAANLAYLILSKFYGEDQIKSELPLNVLNFGKYWIISGTLKTELGGTAELILRKKDGTVLKIIHYK